MRYCPVRYRVFICFLAFGIVASQTNNDGSSPEEICPCQLEDACQIPRHIFGRDPLDIEKFGLISPCKKNGEFPCCPLDPPPAKEIKLTAKDFEGFTPAELVELGVLNNTIGTSTLPLAPQQPLFNEIPSSWKVPVDLKQPGAVSLPPAGIARPKESINTAIIPPTTISQTRSQTAIPHTTVPKNHALRPTYPGPMYHPSAYMPVYNYPQPYHPHPAYYNSYRPLQPRPHYYYRTY